MFSFDCASAPVDIILDHGGDIVKFAGDALIVVFRSKAGSDANDEDDDQDDEAAPTTATAVFDAAADRARQVRLLVRVARCALRIQAELHNYEFGDDAFRLRVKLGVGCGQLAMVHVGGAYERMEYVVTGPPLVQVRCLISNSPRPRVGVGMGLAAWIVYLLCGMPFFSLLSLSLSIYLLSVPLSPPLPLVVFYFVFFFFFCEFPRSCPPHTPTARRFDANTHAAPVTPYSPRRRGRC